MDRKLMLPVVMAASRLIAGPALAQDLTGTLKKIKDTGTITLGHRESSIPFSYYDDKQKVIGYAMDLCDRIVDAVKKELKLAKLDVKLNPVTSATRIPLMANGTVDLECGSTTNNLERQKQVAFTITHFVTANRFVSKVAAKLQDGRRPQGQDRSCRPPAPPTSSRSPRSTARKILASTSSPPRITPRRS